MATQPDTAPPQGVGALAAQLDACSVHTWPARDVVDVDGWSLRFTSGFTHRANSVATLGFTGRDADLAIETVEAEYRRRGLPPMFQITPTSAPLDLEDRLLSRGYRARGRANVCIIPAATLILDAGFDVSLRESPDAEFDALVLTGSKSEADGRERLDVLARIRSPHVCVTVRAESVAVAVGMGAVDQGWLAINMMRTATPHRRRGFARRVLAALAGWATAQGISRAFLGVEEDNTAARALYAKAGFTTVYAYHYLWRP